MRAKNILPFRNLLGAAAGISVVLALSTTAFADVPPPTPEPVGVDLNRLSAELDHFADEANSERWGMALTGLGVGAALLPTGLVLLARADGVSEALVIGMIVGGSLQLVSAPFALLRTRMDEIRDDLRERRSRDVDTGVTLRAIEDEWSNAAASAKRRRTIGGGATIGFGALNLVVGLVFLLAPPGLFGMSRATQYAVGGVTVGVGVNTAAVGARMAIDASPEESSWATYRLMTVPRAITRVSMGLAPVRGGGMGVAMLAF